MTWTTPSKSQSFIHALGIAVLLIGTGFSGVALADCPDTRDQNFLEKCKADKDDFYSKNIGHCQVIEKKCDETSDSGSSKSSSDSDDSPKAECRRIKSKIDDVYTKYTETCSKAGISTDCESTMKRCASVMTSEPQTENAFIAAIGGAFGVQSTQNASAKCSNLTGREFKDAKKEIKDEIKRINDDLKENEDDVNKLNKEYNEEVAKIERKLAEDQKEYAEGKGKAAQNAQTAKANFEKQLAELRARQRGFEASKVKLNNELRSIVRSKNEKLAALLEANTVTICFQRASAISAPKKAHGSLSEQTSAGTSKIKAQQLAYAECKRDIAARRLAVIEDHEAALREKNQQLADTQSEVDQVIQDIASTVQQYEEFLKQQATGQDDALKALNKQIELANKERTALDQDTQKRGEALTKREKLLRDESNVASTEMFALGSPPPKSAGDVSVSNAYSYKQQLDNYKSEYEINCPEDYEKFYAPRSGKNNKKKESAKKGGIGG